MSASLWAPSGQRPDRAAGEAVPNAAGPAHVPGERTSQDAVQRAVDFYTFLGRAPVVLHKEIPGFVGNRLQYVVAREATCLVQQGVVGPEDIDKVLTNSLGIRWATVGLFLGQHLGGGPGGYRHIVTGIGKSMHKTVTAGEPSPDPEREEQVIQAVEKAYGSSPSTELGELRDRRQLALLTALRPVSEQEGHTSEEREAT
ncbi:3-hydroxyacyl-CoA dehydrogenase family protein [Streptomyces sp. NPDC046931]|uniref:3-hydroxyacyl-CoA dehydrogenase family protein n=1 Tax=Streptomyces sp. NPDC046931 TaxID=3154806 RepID=UPI0033CCCD5A